MQNSNNTLDETTKKELYKDEMNEILNNPKIAYAVEKKRNKLTKVKFAKEFEEEYEYLESLTGDNYYTQKELGTVTSLCRKYHYDIKKIIEAFTIDFYPACKFQGLDDNTIHNLLVSLLEFSASQKVTDSMIAEALKELSPMIANNDVNTEKYLIHTKYRMPDLYKMINYTNKELGIYKSGNASEFFSELANILHENYKDTKKIRNKNVKKQKDYTNDKLYESDFLTDIDNWFREDYPGTSKKSKWLIKIFNRIVAQKKKKKEEQNAYRYSQDIKYTKLLPESLIELLKCHIEMFRPISNDYLMCPTPDEILMRDNYDGEEYLSPRMNYYEKFIRNPKDENIKDEINIEEEPQIEPKTETVPASVNTFSLQDMSLEDSIEFENRVKNIFVSILDDFARLKGFNKTS